MDDDDGDGRPPPRAKLLCSFGGTFLPRPLDGKLRYVGGETRILSLPLPALSADLLARVARLFPAARSLKYQPPDEDLDSLVSLLDDADVANMLDEHHRLRQVAPIPARIRLFAFADPSEHEAALLRPRFDADQREVERRYLDALNSAFTPPDGFPGDLGRRYGWDGHRRSYGSPQLQFDCRFASSRADEQFEYGGFHVGSPYSMNGHFGQLLPSGYYESAHLGLDRGNEPYNYRGYDSGPRHGNGGWGYGADGIYHVPYGSGSIHALSEHVHGSLQSGPVRERPAQILQTNLAVNFNYNQPIPVGNLGSSHVGVEERFVAPQVGFHDNVPLHVEGFGAHVHRHEVHTPELNIDKAKLENLRSSSLAHGQYQSGREGGYGAWGPVHLPTSPPSIVANRPLVSMSFVEQPSQYVSEANFQSKGNQRETAEGTHEPRSLYQEFLGDITLELKGKEPAEHDGEGSNLLVYNKLDAPCLDGNEMYPMPELIDALALEGSDEGECPTPPEFNAKSSDDPSKIGPLSHHLEPQGVPKDYEVCTDGDQAVVTKIEPTAAEAEAIQKGLQTIRNDDLEEVSALGTGTYGAVYHGKWKGCDVAIKRIKASCFAGKPSERERLIADFWKEALILSSLHHPNVLTFYGIVRDAPDGNLATVTEFMVSGSLKKFLQKKDRTIDRRKRLIIARDVAFGMEYLHGKNIVHFDLKCENLLVNMRDPHRPICKIGDLGLSKVKQHTFVSGGVRGTLPWMAPELLSGMSNRVSEKVDVYSFGIVLWELLTGEEPYTEMHCASVIGGIINGTLRPQVPAWCDPEWRSLMLSCWSTEPRERPSFSEISQKLRKMAEAINLK